MRLGGGKCWVLAAALLAACGAAGITHRVRPGESLYRIGKAYGVSTSELARVNGIGDPDRIEVGTTLRIPHASRELPVDMITPARARADRPLSFEMPAGRSPFIWPLAAGTLTSRFGPRGTNHHDGIDLSAPAGTPVRAARAGRVLYSDHLRGYGNLIILEHGDGYASVYAHNRDQRVQAGDLVRQGDVIATVGDTGKASGPNLHFEIRKDNVARNPLYFLPAPQGPRTGALRQPSGDTES